MGSISCRMCAAPLVIDNNGFFARCNYCGMTYTLPFEDETDEERMARAEPSLKRARMYLEDGCFTDAAISYERVLDIDPSLGEAYLGKGLAQLKIKKPSQLRSIRRKALQNYYIKKALNFCRGDMKAELADSLGMKTIQYCNDMSINEWRKFASSQRKSFLRELRTHTKDDVPEFKEAVADIEKKYSKTISDIFDKIESCDKEIAAIKEKMQDHLDMALVLNSDKKLGELNRKKKELEREHTEITTRYNNELEEAEAHFLGDKERYSGEEFFRIAEKYPIPFFMPDEKDTILDRVYYALYSQYDFLSLPEIMKTPGCAEFSEKRIEAAIRKLLYTRRIISKKIQGIECYAPVDFEGIVIE